VLVILSVELSLETSEKTAPLHPSIWSWLSGIC